MKIQKKNWGGGRSGLGGGGSGWRGQVGCERRIEVFVKIQTKKKFFLGGVGEGSDRGGGGGMVGLGGSG